MAANGGERVAHDRHRPCRDQHGSHRLERENDCIGLGADSFMRLVGATIALVALGILTYGVFLIVLRGIPPEVRRLVIRRD